MYNNNFTKIKVNQKVDAGLETKMKQECACPISPHGLGRGEPRTMAGWATQWKELLYIIFSLLYRVGVMYKHIKQ